MKEKYAEDHIVPTGTYAAVWVALLILLAATLAVAKLRLLAQFSVLGSLVIASVKGWASSSPSSCTSNMKEDF